MTVHLLGEAELEDHAVVANCLMNRDRRLRGNNGYDRDLRFDPAKYVRDIAAKRGEASWLDLCCGSGLALIEAAAEFRDASVNVAITGVDLVHAFAPTPFDSPELVAASLSSWQPERSFDLITCVHGLHYIGDKLGLIDRVRSWLTPAGEFVANIDKASLLVDGRSGHAVAQSWGDAGLGYDNNRKLLRGGSSHAPNHPFAFVGADPDAGPNYTGQPAVNSHYTSGS